jgi:hypothetical protein
MIKDVTDTCVRSRALTAQEEIYWRLTFSDQIHFVVVAEVSGHTQVEQWREALDSVQRRHPLLRVAVEMPGHGNSHQQPFFVPQQAAIPLRVEVLDEKQGTVAAEMQRELATPFVCGVSPLARAVLLHASERSIVLLALSHSIADGMSGLFLLRDLLTTLSGQPLQTLVMPPSAEELLGVSPIVSLSVPADENHVSANAGREPSVLLRSLSEDATRNLIDTARRHRSTVQEALAAAFVQALRQLVPRLKTDPVRIISPVNTRAELGAGDALGMYFTSPQLSFEPNSGDSFWDLALEARFGIAMSSSRSALLQATAAMQGLTKPGLSNKSAASMLEHAFAMDLLLSNLGRIPYSQEFGHFFIQRVWGPAVLAGEKTQAVGVITTGDQLCFTLTSRHPVEHLLDRAIDVLTEQIHLAHTFDKHLS